MLKYLLCGLPLILIALPCANTSSIDAVPVVQEETCETSTSPECQNERSTNPLDFPTIGGMIRDGVTSQQLYDGESTSIGEKRKLESRRI